MLQTHHRLGEFEIIRLLGKGGMGEVYEAQQDRPHRRVALKVLAPWLTQNEDALKRFWREAETPAQLNHPGIVRIISTGQTDGIAYYTMHLVEGISLADLIRQARDNSPPTVPNQHCLQPTPSLEPSLTPPREEALFLPSSEQAPTFIRAYKEDRFRTVARIGVMVARALAYAHGQGCVHRDLKPANIMVDQHDQAYVVDFGLTRALEPDGLQSHLGTVIGTPWYMSPEQARGDHIDHRSDIYSLGVTLYELATQGNGPYAATREQCETVLSQVRSGQFLPLRSHAPDIPPALESVILRAMSFQPEGRYPDAGQLASDLERYLEQAPASRSTPASPSSRRSKSLLLGGAVGLIVLAVFLAWFWGRESATGRENKNVDDPTKIDVPADYPEQLRVRTWKVPQSLLTSEHEPLWHRRLAGTGQFSRQRFQLMLSAPREDDHPTLLALDDDPQRRWFEYSIDLNAPLAEQGKNRFGVFFGWRKDTDRFFIVELDEHPLPGLPQGVARLGTMRIIERKGAGLPGNDIRWLPADRGQVPLKKSRAWHTLAVRVFADRILLTVDAGHSVPLSMDWLAENQRDVAVAVNPRGALGVWMYNGFFGSFRNAFVTVLPAGEKGTEK